MSMFKNRFSLLATLGLLVILIPCDLHVEIHFISGWDLQVDISSSGADTVKETYRIKSL